MKHHRTQFVLSIMLMLAAACVGITARQKALLPQLVAAWPSIGAEVDLGVGKTDPAKQQDLRAQRDAATTALASGDKTQIGLIAWPDLRKAAAVGIGMMVEAGTISNGVASAMQSRDDLFFTGINTYLER